MSMKTLAARMEYLGGSQLNRINKQKLRSFQMATKNSYSTRYIKVDHSVWPCFIGTMSGGLKADYDYENFAVEYASGLKPGKTFEVLDDGTHWMVYLQKMSETAYLSAQIVECRYTLEIDGKTYWIYCRGPVETDLRWFLKNNININELNLSARIFIENNESTRKFFKRFTKLKIDGHRWEVQVTDSLSTPGILQLEIQEYYDNSIEELPEIKNMGGATPVNVISGEDVVKQDTVVGYAINDLAYDPKIQWEVRNNPRVKVQEILEDGRVCKVRVYPGAIKTFDIVYGEQFKTVTVDWAKPVIQGPQTVYPYDTHTYWIKGDDRKVKFSIDSPLAEIIDSDDGSCKVEILSGKRGTFTIKCELEDGSTTELEVEIKSL